MRNSKVRGQKRRLNSLLKNSDYLKKARKYGHFTGYEN